MRKKNTPPGATGEALSENNSPLFCSANHTENPEIPSRAALARKWPKLRLNRFTGAWRDDATGARGSDVASLRAFLAWGGARR